MISSADLENMPLKFHQTLIQEKLLKVTMVKDNRSLVMVLVLDTLTEHWQEEMISLMTFGRILVLVNTLLVSMTM